jgi:osomolarity two-component system, sensor histidine kinase SLN1
MSSWLSHLRATKVHIPWIAPALADMTNDDDKLPDSLPSKVEDSLPPPVLQTNNTRQIRRKSARFGGIAVYWAKFKRHLGTDTVPSSSSQVGESAVDNSYIQMAQEDGAIDEVVVDRVWSEEIKSVESHSDHGASPGESHQFNPSGSDRESLVYEGFWSMWPPLAIIRWRAWPLVMEIFSSRFIDEKSEQHYAQVSHLESISLSTLI